MINIGPISDFPEGKARAVTIDGRDIAIVTWRGAHYAIRNRCPHMHAPLSDGFLAPKLCAGADVGTIDVDDSSPVLSCPWHIWQFDLKTGHVLGDPRYRIATFKTDCREGCLYVDLTGS